MSDVSNDRIALITRFSQFKKFGFCFAENWPIFAVGFMNRMPLYETGHGIVLAFCLQRVCDLIVANASEVLHPSNVYQVVK